MTGIKGMQGKIIKGIAGFYYVHVEGSGIYECRAKGIFRKENIRPLVGDDVQMDVISEEEHTGNVAEILPRRNELDRPAVANVDQALVIFAVRRPDPNFNLLDRFLVRMEDRKIPPVVCFNKADLAEDGDRETLSGVYEKTGYPLVFSSAMGGEGIGRIRELLRGKTTTVAGPSGAGKSSLINLLAPDAQMETGELSEKIGRGKNTTRHAEILVVEDGTYIVDTPGFTSLSVENIEKEKLGTLFPEFVRHEPYCRFAGCSHISEPECGVKDAVREGEISRVRYEDYVQIYEELKNRKKY